jgi:hypothetical protein
MLIIDEADLERVLACAAECLAADYDWVTESALTERAFALGVRAVLVQIVPPDLRGAVETAAFRAVSATMFPRGRDDTFRGTAAGRLISSLHAHVDGVHSFDSEFDRLLGACPSIGTYELVETTLGPDL